MRAFYNYLSTIYLKSYGSNYDRMLSGVGCHASAKPVLEIRAGMSFEDLRTCLRKS